MYNRTKKIPTIIALTILVIGIGAGIYLTETRLSQKPQALLSSQPEEVQITNLSDNLFSVVWLTKKKATGSVTFGSSAEDMDQLALDDRDIDSPQQKYLTHHVTIRNLSSQTKYYFSVISDGKKYQNNDSQFQIVTAEKSNQANTLEPSYGQIVNQQNQPAEGSIVILNLPRSLPLSTLVKPSGNWLIPLNNARDVDLKIYPDSETIPISLSVLLSVDEKAQATFDTQNDSPVPLITIGKTYNFEGLKSKQKTTNPLALKPENPLQVLGEKTNQSVEIITPVEGATFVSTRPLFRGKGIPGKEVLIEIESVVKISGKTTVGKDGYWTFTPAKDLSADKHTIKITTLNENNQSVSLQKSFLVFKSGTQVLGEATPSGTLTPALSPSPTTSIGSASPSATLTPFVTSVPVTPSVIPVAGNISTTYFMLTAGIILFIFGFAKFIISSV